MKWLKHTDVQLIPSKSQTQRFQLNQLFSKLALISNGRGAAQVKAIIVKRIGGGG